MGANHSQISREQVRANIAEHDARHPAREPIRKRPVDTIDFILVNGIFEMVSNGKPISKIDETNLPPADEHRLDTRSKEHPNGGLFAKYAHQSPAVHMDNPRKRSEVDEFNYIMRTKGLHCGF